MDIRKIDVPRTDYAQKLGYLAGVTGFHRERSYYTGPLFSEEMLVFSGMSPEQLDVFLDAYKRTPMLPISLKAVITLHNISWTPEALFLHLLQERLQ